jgi:hypothetical protein
MHVNWSIYVTPTVIGASATLVSAVLVYLLNHRSGLYKDELTKTMKVELSAQTAAIVKTQVECKDEIVSAIHGLKA